MQNPRDIPIDQVLAMNEARRLRTEIRILESRLLALTVAATEFEEWFGFYHLNSAISDDRWAELMTIHESESGWRNDVAASLSGAARAVPVNVYGEANSERGRR